MTVNSEIIVRFLLMRIMQQGQYRNSKKLHSDILYIYM